jgi:hypothetical protein
VAKQQVSILKQERAAEGSAKVQAAVAGARGRRVALARAKEVEGVAGDALTALADASERKQEQLIDESRYTSRKHIMDMIAGSPATADTPSTAELMLPNIAGGIEAAYSDYTYRKERESEIVKTGVKLQVPGTDVD